MRLPRPQLFHDEQPGQRGQIALDRLGVQSLAVAASVLAERLEGNVCCRVAPQRRQQSANSRGITDDAVNAGDVRPADLVQVAAKLPLSHRW